VRARAGELRGLARACNALTTTHTLGEAGRTSRGGRTTSVPVRGPLIQRAARGRVLEVEEVQQRVVAVVSDVRGSLLLVLRLHEAAKQQQVAGGRVGDEPEARVGPDERGTRRGVSIDQRQILCQRQRSHGSSACTRIDIPPFRPRAGRARSVIEEPAASPEEVHALACVSSTALHSSGAVISMKIRAGGRHSAGRAPSW
jgi:hypothetical protein